VASGLEGVGKNPLLAMTAKLRVEHHFDRLGLAAPAPVIEAPGRTNLASAMKEYLGDILTAKSTKTLYAYTVPFDRQIR
jgi:hypothetical protein